MCFKEERAIFALSDRLLEIEDKITNLGTEPFHVYSFLMSDVIVNEPGFFFYV